MTRGLPRGPTSLVVLMGHLMLPSLASGQDSMRIMSASARADIEQHIVNGADGFVIEASSPREPLRAPSETVRLGSGTQLDRALLEHGLSLPEDQHAHR